MVFSQIPEDHNQLRIRKVDKTLESKLELKIPVNNRDIHKIEKKDSIHVSFLVMKTKENTNICIEKHFQKIC